MKHNGLSIAGFVVSLVSIFVMNFFGITGLVGLVLSAVGRSKAVADGDKTGMATAGIVLGIVSIVVGVASIVAAGAAVGQAMSLLEQYY